MALPLLIPAALMAARVAAPILLRSAAMNAVRTQAANLVGRTVLPRAASTAGQAAGRAANQAAGRQAAGQAVGRRPGGDPGRGRGDAALDALDMTMTVGAVASESFHSGQSATEAFGCGCGHAMGPARGGAPGGAISAPSPPGGPGLRMTSPPPGMKPGGPAGARVKTWVPHAIMATLLMQKGKGVLKSATTFVQNQVGRFFRPNRSPPVNPGGQVPKSPYPDSAGKGNKWMRLGKGFREVFGFVADAAGIASFLGYDMDSITGNSNGAPPTPSPERFDPCACLKHAAGETQEAARQNMTASSHASQQAMQFATNINDSAARLAMFDIAGGGHAEAVKAIMDAANGDLAALKQNYSVTAGLLERHMMSGMGQFASMTGSHDLFFQNLRSMLVDLESGPYRRADSPAGSVPAMPPATPKAAESAAKTEEAKSSLDICKCLPPSAVTRPPASGSDRFVKEDVRLSEENLVLLQHLAEPRSVTNFVTLTPTVQVTTGDIRQEADIDDLIARVTQAMSREIDSSARGAYSY